MDDYTCHSLLEAHRVHKATLGKAMGGPAPAVMQKQQRDHLLQAQVMPVGGNTNASAAALAAAKASKTKINTYNDLDSDVAKKDMNVDIDYGFDMWTKKS